MPSNRKKRIRARMAKTGERWSTAAQNTQRGAGARIKHGRYSGVPKLPEGPTSAWLDAQGRVLPDDGTRPQVEFVNIQGDFDPRDLKKAWVPSTAFDDPTMPRDPSWPPDVKRVLTLAEYIDARTRQTGWQLERVQPGPVVFMGKVLSVLLQWSTARQHERGRP